MKYSKAIDSNLYLNHNECDILKNIKNIAYHAKHHNRNKTIDNS